jgi:hypothetical protein
LSQGSSRIFPAIVFLPKAARRQRQTDDKTKKQQSRVLKERRCQKALQRRGKGGKVVDKSLNLRVFFLGKIRRSFTA